MGSSQDNTEIAQYAVKGANFFQFYGDNKDFFHEAFCREIGVKNNRDITADLLVTNQRVIVAPGGKDHSDLAVLGAMFGGPIGLVIMSGLGAATTKWATRNTIDNSSGGELPRHCIVWSRSNMLFEVFEERTDWDFFGGSWMTAVRFSGQCDFNDEKHEGTIEFQYSGRFGSSGLRAKPKKAIPLLEAFSFAPSDVLRRKETWSGEKIIIK